MGARLTPEKIAAIRTLHDAGMKVPSIARELDIGHVAAGRHVEIYQREKGEPAEEPVEESPAPADPNQHPDEHLTFDESGDDRKLTCVTREEVKTEEDLVRVCKIDLTRWRIERMRVKAYQAAMKLETKEIRDQGGRRVIAHRPHTVQLFSISADLIRVMPKPFLDATEALYARLEAIAPRWSGPPGDWDEGSVDPPSRAPYLCQIGLYDVHFGKLAWAPESGQDYDLRITETVFRNAADDLLNLLSPYTVGRFVVPIGHDFFHVDQGGKATTAGTIVDTDGRYAKMIEIGEMAAIRLVSRLLAVAPVDVVYVPGNHDRISSYHLCRSIAAWFRKTRGVKVDLSPAVMKYARYGSCLFGYRHGDGLTDSELPTLPGLMATEAPADWALSSSREWLVGHKHTSKRFVSRAGDERQGVQIRYLSSLSAPDAWHAEKGYVGNRRAAEAYLYDTETDLGYVGHFVAPARG